jgi:Flp pilus assembly secretin CpaC
LNLRSIKPLAALAARLALTGFGLSVAAGLAAPPALALRPDISIPLGQTTIVTAPDGVDRLVVGDSNIADVVALPGGREILVNAKKVGFTNFLVFPARGPVRPYRLEVIATARDESIAVRVQVLEVTERKTGQVGVRWNDKLGFSEAAPNAPFRFGLPIRTDLLTATLNTLAQDRDIRVLAQPTLVIQNGKKGEFLAGGQLPVPLLQATAGGATYTVDWKEYGVKLEVQPRLEGNDGIALAVRPEYSTIDLENAVQLRDINVPGLATRWAKTEVQVNSGESLVIAGLLRNEKFRTSSKLPWLGDVPVLGYLFGAANYDERVSELVFIVTPSIVSRNVVKPESDYGKGTPGVFPKP